MYRLKMILARMSPCNQETEGTGSAPPPPEPVATPAPAQDPIAQKLAQLEQQLQAQQAQQAQERAQFQAYLQQLQAQNATPAPNPVDDSTLDPAVKAALDAQKAQLTAATSQLTQQQDVIAFHQMAAQMGLSQEEIQQALATHQSFVQSGQAELKNGRRMTPLDVHFFIQGRKTVEEKVKARVSANAVRVAQNVAATVETTNGRAPALPQNWDQLSESDKANHPDAWKHLDEAPW